MGEADAVEPKSPRWEQTWRDGDLRAIVFVVGWPTAMEVGGGRSLTEAYGRRMVSL